ncbi:hypothetical protein NA57DRAFT_63397 [Rhizodiscina lignyota]|uniref:Zn(2)-C6 fungal-type domain-containing protein n=1 Tax=Rhizodiscina lignyota TaxID=1504668 RepID=A0A9P4M971_9PEZI|nr:hypothetical protein NA57DRAFT_63397 [Rhizodiscina lignyota]
MCVTRSCLPCRGAKAKCDLVRPSCGRCTQRGLICSGFPEDADFVFLDENETAQRNSQRARKEWRRSPGAGTSSSLTHVQQGQQSPAAANEVDEFLRQQYSWLNERAYTQVSEPLKRDLEARAVERFFINWTLHPSNHGVSPGHMHDLPMLFLGAPPDSILWHAVRAVAFADMRNESSGDSPFYVKSRLHYGAALNRTRMILHDQQDLSNDRVLSAILLIDNFELMYLMRTDPVGPHSEAIKHILHSRGDGQLYDSAQFSLWRLAHHRLLSRQVLLREQPDPEQIAWVSKLNVDRPDLHICADVLHMNILSAAAKKLTQTIDDTEPIRGGKLEQAKQMTQEMLNLIETIESWTLEMTGVWKPKIEDTQSIAKPQDVGESPNFPIPHFPCPRFLRYQDIWLAYMWNFYAASQIVLRESLTDVVTYAATLLNQEEPDENGMSVIQKQRGRVDMLSAAIIRSFPMLLGFTHRHERPGGPRVLQQGKMAGRLFSLFSMWVVQKAQFTSSQHKQTASEVISWINFRHGLH